VKEFVPDTHKQVELLRRKELSEARAARWPNTNTVSSTSLELGALLAGALFE
jgi:hypothetical protein